jgi:hypothetical protein
LGSSPKTGAVSDGSSAFCGSRWPIFIDKLRAKDYFFVMKSKPIAHQLKFQGAHVKSKFLALIAIIAIGSNVFGIEGTNSPYTDAAGDIDPGIANAGGTLDILGMEVSHTATDIMFKLTLNGNYSTGGNDWGQFMIGFSTGSTATTNTGNGWTRPIQLNSPLGGMDYWIGSWVNAGGGSQLWSYDGASWTNAGALPSYVLTAGATSTLDYTLPLASLGLSAGDTFYFDAYSSGGGGGDSAVDALANPNVSISGWGGPYTSKTTETGGPGLNKYTVTAIPEPATVILFGIGGIGAWLVRRNRFKTNEKCEDDL